MPASVGQLRSNTAGLDSPMTGYNRAPIIAIGMHRSGTTLLSQLLDMSGNYSGWKKDVNNESQFFITLNEWILAQSGASWDNPAPADSLFKNEALLAGMENHVRSYLASPYSLFFTGRRALSGEGLTKGFRSVWGWKDPRSTVTLPLWMRLYPQAKILNVKRHGVDVAASLRTRQLRLMDRMQSSYPTGRGTLRPPVFRARKLANSFRCVTLEGALGLWAEYCEYAEAWLENVPEERKLSIRYEDLLLDPDRVLEEVFGFCELDMSAGVGKHRDKINPDRANAWQSSDELRAFASNSTELLARHGYSV